jgi:hypothetical protein
VESSGVGRGVAVGRDPLDALEKNARLHIAVLVGVQNVAPALKNPTRDPGDETGLIGAMEKSDECGQR